MTISASPSCVATPVSRALVTSRINRTITPSGILSALTDETTQSIIRFDECRLFIPVPEDGGFRVWYASPSNGLHDTQAARIAQVPSVVARSLTTGAVEVLSHDALMLPANRALVSGFPAQTITSAGLLPLSTDDESFGALVFISLSEVYQPARLDEIRWLIDHTAVAVQAALLREQLQHQNTDRISTLENLKRAFVHTLVRDVRLPLTGVLSFLDTCEAKLLSGATFDHDDRCLLNTAAAHTRIICETIDDHLEVARDEERPLILARRFVTAPGIVTDAVECVNAEAALRGIKLHTRFAPTLPTLNVDQTHVTRALIYLLTTALAATGDGGEIQVEAVTTSDPSVKINMDDKAVAFNITHIATPDDDAAPPCDSFWQSPASPHHPDISFTVACRIARAHGGDLITYTRDHIETVHSLVLPVDTSQTM